MRWSDNDPTTAGGHDRSAAGGPSAGYPNECATARGDSREATLEQERPTLSVNNPHTQMLMDDAAAAVARLRAAIDDGLLDAGDALGVAARLQRLGQQVQALHYAAVSTGDESGMWAIAGYLSTESWLRHTQLLSPFHARECARTSRWLRHQPVVATALANGDINDTHVQAMRRVVTSSTKRAAAFADVAAQFVEVARNADSDVLGRALRSWADAVDESAGNRGSGRDHQRRRVFLSPVGDGWDLKGWLPAAEGAELAGILTERMEQMRRETPDISMTAPQRRADSLLELLRSAAAGAMSPAQRERARVQVLIPLGRLANCTQCRSLGNAEQPLGNVDGFQGPDLEASQWRSGNGWGRGVLSMAEAKRLSCDGQIQRVVLSPDSAVLDVGRTYRLATPAIRSALEVRDGGCVIPECDRPPGWCEAHHIVHWSEGGSSAVSNMALLCSRHHHELHQGKWHLRIDDVGRVQVERRMVRQL